MLIELNVFFWLCVRAMQLCMESAADCVAVTMHDRGGNPPPAECKWDMRRISEELQQEPSHTSCIGGAGSGYEVCFARTHFGMPQMCIRVFRMIT